MDEGQSQISNQESVQGQNIAHSQQITQLYFDVNGESAHSPLPENIWLVPYERNQFFTGREGLLKRLRDTLTAMKTGVLTPLVAISGLGGIGKTQTAIEYAYRYRGDYQAILRARATTRDMLTSDFVTLAAVLLSDPRISVVGAIISVAG